jgi:hypothetical protein
VASALAVARLARLVTTDAIFDRPRNLITGMGKGEGGTAKRTKAALFITCPWCTSVWLAGGVVVATRFVPGIWAFPAALLAFSEVAGLLAGHEAG